MRRYLSLALPLVWAAAVVVAPAGADTIDFHATTAQIVPVLLLVLAIEVRLFEARRGPSERVHALMLLIILFAAEVAALVPRSPATCQTAARPWWPEGS